MGGVCEAKVSYHAKSTVRERRLSPTVRRVPMNMELEEAQLFRMLTDLFGRDSVIFRMSALAVCGGELGGVPAALKDGFTSAQELARWAARESCLFTVIAPDDSPRLVVEFAEEFRDVIEPDSVDHHRVLPSLLDQVGVRYIRIARGDFAAMLDPAINYDLIMMLEGLFDDSGDDGGDE